MANVYVRLQKKISPSRVRPVQQPDYRRDTIISTMYIKLGKKRSTSRTKTILEVEIQMIDDKFGDKPMKSQII